MKDKIVSEIKSILGAIVIGLIATAWYFVSQYLPIWLNNLQTFLAPYF